MFFDRENIYLLETANKNINFENNIFGYRLIGIRFISSLNQLNLGFYLYSKNLNKKISSNELVSLDDILYFKVVDEIGVKKGSYSLEIEGIVNEPNYDIFIQIPDLVEYFPLDNSNIDLEPLYEP